MSTEKIAGTSLDIEAVELEKLKAVFPQCFNEGKLDTEKLLSLVGKYAAKDREHYNFEWNGKNDCYRLAASASTATLRPCKDKSVNFDTTKNLYIEGDNLEVLKTLQKAYYGKVKMIYIDPPYNTGNDFVYEDDFKDPLAKYKELTAQATKSNPETAGRYHTNWLNMMFPRLRLAYNLLRDDGVIFISIDDNEVTNLRKLCDEVFGEENFVANIVKVGNSAKNNVKQLSITHEYCVVYCKNKGLLNDWQVIRTNATEFQKRASSLVKSGLSNSEISKELRTLVKYPRFYDFDHYTYCDKRGVFRANDLTAPSSKNYFDIMHPVTHKPCKTGTRGWAYTQSGIEELLKQDLILFGEDETVMPQLKCYLADTLTQSPRGIMFFDSQTDTKWIKANNLGFDFPKPVEYIKHLLSMCTINDDIVLDFFSGSATTAHAVMELNAEDGGNRRFIMVQLPELCDEKSEAFKAGYKNICDIGEERIRRAGKKILEQYKDKLAERKEPLDIGFKVFALDSSNLVSWDASALTKDQVAELYERMDALSNTIKKGRSDLDLVYEMMLKLCVPLDEPVRKTEVNSKAVWTVGADNELVLCLNENAQTITAEDIEILCKKFAPAKIVAAEAAFKDDSALSNAYFTLHNREIQIKLI